MATIQARGNRTTSVLSKVRTESYFSRDKNQFFSYALRYLFLFFLLCSSTPQYVNASGQKLQVYPWSYAGRQRIIATINNFLSGVTPN